MALLISYNNTYKKEPMKSQLEERKEYVIVGASLLYVDNCNTSEFRVLDCDNIGFTSIEVTDEFEPTPEYRVYEELQKGWSLKPLRGVTLGDKFIRSGKRGDLCTVVDFHTTRNISGEIINQHPIAEYMFLEKKTKDSTTFASVVRGAVN